MKPIHLNLASRPYRDYMPVNLVAGSMFVLTLILAWFNLDTYLRYNVETKATRAKIADLESQERREQQLLESAETRLASIDVKFLDDQTRFINTKLTERAFSWSMLLDELESVLDDDVRLLSIGPTFKPNGTIDLGLSLQSKSGEGMIRTINRMHGDPQFMNPFPHNESFDGNIYSFNMTVTFRPPGPATIGAAEVTK